MKKTIFIFLGILIFISCKKEGKITQNPLAGKIKSIAINDSVQHSKYDYEFYYDAEKYGLSNIKKYGSLYIEINRPTDSQLIVKRYDDSLGIEQYEIKYDANKNTQFIKYKLDSINEMDNYLFTYKNNTIDSIYEFGLFLFKFYINNYDFTFVNNNCSSYTSTYYDQNSLQITQNVTITYYNYLNNSNIPFQSILQFPDIYISTSRGVISLPYIANLCGLNVGFTNKNLIKEKTDWRYEYSLNANNVIVEIKEYATFDNTLYRTYKLNYY